MVKMYESVEPGCWSSVKSYVKRCFYEKNSELYERKKDDVKKNLVGSVKSVKRGEAYYYDRSIVVVLRRLDQTRCLIVSTFHYGPVTTQERYFEHVVNIADLGSTHV